MRDYIKVTQYKYKLKQRKGSLIMEENLENKTNEGQLNTETEQQENQQMVDSILMRKLE